MDAAPPRPKRRAVAETATLSVDAFDSSLAKPLHRRASGGALDFWLPADPSAWQEENVIMEEGTEVIPSPPYWRL